MSLGTTVTAKHGTEYLWKPLSKSEIIKQMEVDGMVKGKVAIDVSDMIEYGLESIDDIISEALTGTICLQEISFKPIDVDEYSVVFEVTGWMDDQDLEYL